MSTTTVTTTTQPDGTTSVVVDVDGKTVHGAEEGVPPAEAAAGAAAAAAAAAELSADFVAAVLFRLLVMTAVRRLRCQWLTARRRRGRRETGG